MKNPMGKVTFILIVVMHFLTSCALYDIAPKKVKKSFNYQYVSDEFKTGIYVYTNVDSTEDYTCFIFFEDGTFVQGIYSNYLAYKNFNNIYDYLNAVETDSSINYYYHRRLAWGYYELYNNQLEVKFIVGRHYGSGYWFAFRDSYEIIGDGKIKRLESEEIHPGHKWDKSYENELNRNLDSKFHELNFVDTCNCKESDTWLKYEKWFWKNEQDYLNWIEKNDGNKRKYHY